MAETKRPRRGPQGEGAGLCGCLAMVAVGAALAVIAELVDLGPLLAVGIVLIVSALPCLLLWFRIREKRLPKAAHRLGSRDGRAEQERLVALGAAAVPTLLRALDAPAYGWSGGGASWDGNLARRRAAEALGEIRAVEAVEPLVGLAHASTDVGVRIAAIDALGRIGGERAVVGLLPLVVEDVTRATQAPANQALVELGQADLLKRLRTTLLGGARTLAPYLPRYRAGIVAALRQRLRHGPPEEAPAIARAVSALGLVELLPALREARTSGAVPSDLATQAIEALEALQSLPRAAEPVIDTSALPRPADEPSDELTVG